MITQEKDNFSVVYEEYLIFKKSELKEQSYTSLVYNFDKYILPFFKDYYLDNITKKTILEWKQYIINFNFSNNYNRTLYFALSGFFEYCKENYNFDKLIISSLGNFKRKYEEDKHDFYTRKEFNKFIKFVEEQPYKAFFNFMFFTGTRPGEAMALKFSDIHSDYVYINKTISSHGKRNIGTPKNNSSIRKIIIDKKLKNELLNLEKYYLSIYNDFSANYFVFGGQKPLSPTSINRRKEKACKMANIRCITLHQFRHSHATLLKDNGVNVVDVSKRLGHSNVSTTLDIYTHTSSVQEKRVQRTLNSLRFNIITSLVLSFKSIIKRH